MEGSHRGWQRYRRLRLEAVESRLLLSADWTGLEQVRTAYGLTGQGQTVAVIDTGIDYRHVALGGGFGAGYRVVGGYDFAEQDADPYDDGPAGSHGTLVAGVIGSGDAAHPGVAPGVDLVALRVCDDSGAGSLGLVEQALEWVHANRNAMRYPITTVNLSLGSAGNFSTPPDWAFLEADLAQLDADGIFVSVAAGNGFTACKAPGVDYPAVSPYVVPVAAGDAAGNLAGFSQRDARTIVAPGVAVVSTVPDYIGNHDGIDDDFGSFSGTSTAAAFVAGASVLLREACQQAGMTHVTEETLYHLMISSADTIHDAVTGRDYYRLDLARAVESVLPPPAAVASRIDWGTIDQQTFGGYQIGAAGQWFTLTAANSGLLTIEAIGGTAGGHVSLDLFDSAGKQLGTSGGPGSSQRLDVSVAAGATVSLHALADSSSGVSVEFRVTNLVSQSGTTVHVAGTQGNDSFTFAAQSGLQCTINNVAYQFSRGTVTGVTFDGGSGTNRVALAGSSGTDTAVIRPGSVELDGLNYWLRAVGARVATVDGGGGTDSAVVYASTGDDRLLAVGNRALVCNASADVTLDGFHYIRAVAGIQGAKKVQFAAVDFVLQLDGPWTR